MQVFHALNANTPGAVAFNFCAHFDEHFGQVPDFRLLSSVFQNRLAFCQRCRHQEILGASNSHHVGRDAAAFKARAASGQPGNHVAVLHHNLGAHRLQAFDVLIYWPRADGATTGQGHRGFAKTCEQRA